MKLAVIGNCQWVGVTRCLRTVTGLQDIVGINGELLESAPASVLPDIEAAEIVFVQTGNCDTLLAGLAPDQAARALRFPRITFGAFHPDMCVVRSDEAIAQTPLGNNNSRITFAAFKKGLSAQDTVALFNARVFAGLSYFEWWDRSKKGLDKEFEQSDVETTGLLARWTRAGCFMHSTNHPKLHVLADVACAIADHVKLPVSTRRPDAYVHDSLKDAPVWPIYPEIAAGLGLEGDYCFKTGVAQEQRILSLPDFVEGSFEAYRARSALYVPNMDIDAFADRMLAAAEARTAPSAQVSSPKRASKSPYANLHPHQSWRNAVAAPAASDVDPVVATRFKLAPGDRVASVGSCFAQHISRRLKSAGLNYLVTEQAPVGVSAADAERRGFYMFSARYGNIYSARQLDQLFARALGDGRFVEAPWRRDDGRLADPFRPSVEPDGFADEAALRASERTHLAAVRDMMEQLDVLVFTLGLTEAWRAKGSGAVFPTAPGVAAGEWDAAAYEFVNFSVEDVVADIVSAFDKVRQLNVRARFILTVSPVPLIATYEQRHVLQATTYSKSVLRTAADIVRQRYADVDYFPSFEIVSSTFTRGAYFEPDLRSVTPAGVDHVMRLFLRHVYGRSSDDAPQMPDYEIFCDEDANG